MSVESTKDALTYDVGVLAGLHKFLFRHLLYGLVGAQQDVEAH